MEWQSTQLVESIVFSRLAILVGLLTVVQCQAMVAEEGPLIPDTISTLSSSVAELDVMSDRFTQAGWTTQTYETSLHKLLVVSWGNQPNYMFRYEKWHGALRAYPSRDPNLLPDMQMSGDPASIFFETPDWRELMDVGIRIGFARTSMQTYADQARSRSSGGVILSESGATRTLTSAEGAALLVALRRDGVARRVVFDAAGERVEEIPFDALIQKGKVRGNLVWVELNSKIDPLLTKYPIIVYATSVGLRVVYEHKNDTDNLPFDPAFPDVVEMYKEAGDLPDVWNWYFKENQGQAGLWLRSEMRKPGRFQVWSPSERDAILKSLSGVTREPYGLVYARSGNRAIAQFYGDNDTLRYAEFLSSELLRVRTLDEAIEHLQRTSSGDVWNCYSGVSQQFGHPRMLQMVYSTRIKGG